MWIYVIINADIPNLTTETCILHDFALKGTSTENDYILILFIQAVEHFKREGLSNPASKVSNISPIYIQTKTIIPEIPNETYSTRSQSIFSNSSKLTNGVLSREKDENGLFGSVTSSIKGLFK